MNRRTYLKNMLLSFGIVYTGITAYRKFNNINKEYSYASNPAHGLRTWLRFTNNFDKMEKGNFISEKGYPLPLKVNDKIIYHLNYNSERTWLIEITDVEHTVSKDEGCNHKRNSNGTVKPDVFYQSITYYFKPIEEI